MVVRTSMILSSPVRNSSAGMLSMSSDFKACFLHYFRTFWIFSEHFKDEADKLMNSLDPAKQKALNGAMSNSTSTTSLASSSNIVNNSRAKSKISTRTRSLSTDGRGREMTYGYIFSFRGGFFKINGSYDFVLFSAAQSPPPVVPLLPKCRPHHLMVHVSILTVIHHWIPIR